MTDPLTTITQLGRRRQEAVDQLERVEGELKTAIRAARAANPSLTVRQLAALVGVSHQTIHNWLPTAAAKQAS